MAIRGSILFVTALISTATLGCRTTTAASKVKATTSDAEPLQDTPAANDAGTFHYDEQDGTCKDANGTIGLNKINLEMFVAAKGGECSTFTGVGIINAHVLSICGGHAPCEMDGWNFRGADLNSLMASGGPHCGLTFKDADLRGAHMDHMRILYTCIEGTIDGFTTVGNSTCSANAIGCCVTGDHIKCVK